MRATLLGPGSQTETYALLQQLLQERSILTHMCRPRWWGVLNWVKTWMSFSQSSGLWHVKLQDAPQSVLPTCRCIHTVNLPADSSNCCPLYALSYWSPKEDPTLGWWADVPVLSPQMLIVNHALHGRNWCLSPPCKMQEAQALTQILRFQVLWWWEWCYDTTLLEWRKCWESLCRSPWGELAKWTLRVHTWPSHN